MFDIFSNILPAKKPTETVVILDIDDKSLKDLGQWPWPRYRIANLLRAVSENGASAIGIDMIFPEPDRTSVSEIMNSFHNEFGLDVTFSGIPKGMEDNDAYMAKVISNGPFVLSNFFYFDRYTDPARCYTNAPEVTGLPADNKLNSAKGLLCNLKMFSANSGISGFFNAMHDGDGMMRRLPLMVKYGNDIFPGLSLAVFMKATNQHSIEVGENFIGPYISIWDKKIYYDEKGNVLLNFGGGKNRFQYISASNVLTGKTDLSVFKGKIVLVGSSATGLNDIHSTSFEPYYPGVEVHATLLDNLIRDDFFFVPKWNIIFEMISVALWGVAVIIFLSRAGSLFNLLFLPAVIGSIALGSFLLLNFTGMYISPASTMVTVLFIWVSLTFIKYFLEEKRLLYLAEVLAQTQEATILSMASVAETRDPETGGHIFRTQNYVRILAEYLSRDPAYKNKINEGMCSLLYKSAPLHDVGKVGVPDKILLKNGKLDEEEFEQMKLHTLYGCNMIRKAETGLDDNGFLKYAYEIARSHHERWDGKGYPDGLKEEEIPLSARLMAVADVYDALISKRHYKEAFELSEAERIIEEGRGSHFDPAVVDAFTALKADFRMIAEKYKDS
jgi:adenylate cyclase